MKIKLTFRVIVLLTAGVMLNGCKKEEIYSPDIFYSEWKKLGMVEQKSTSSGHWEYPLDMPELTQDILDNGVVLIYYVGCCGVQYIYQLPATIYNERFIAVQFPQTLGLEENSPWYRVKLFSNFQLAHHHQYRYVLIKGGASKSIFGVNLSDYEEVKRALGGG